MFKGELINRAPTPNKEVAIKRLLKGFRGDDILVDEEIKVRGYSGYLRQSEMICITFRQE